MHVEFMIQNLPSFVCDDNLILSYKKSKLIEVFIMLK